MSEDDKEETLSEDDKENNYSVRKESLDFIRSKSSLH